MGDSLKITRVHDVVSRIKKYAVLGTQQGDNRITITTPCVSKITNTERRMITRELKESVFKRDITISGPHKSKLDKSIYVYYIEEGSTTNEV